MYAKTVALLTTTLLSGCVLDTNNSLEDVRIGMTIAQAETILGEPVSVHPLRTVEGTISAKDIERECRTYIYDHDQDDDDASRRTDRLTWVTYNSGRVARYSDNGYASSNGSYCHG